MSGDVKKEREAFEKHFSRVWDISRLSYVFDYGKDSDYADRNTECYWAGWLARASVSTPPGSNDK